ncbi:MAG: CPBP family intramembrane metalloprotease [Paracoccaceae bacterium]|nr:CPBP family intramembrane metalloprotease [Paracoccaceae bacterium]
MSKSQTANAETTLGGRLSQEKPLQIIELLVVFSPALLIIAIFQFFSLENPMLYIAAIWLANIAMLALVWSSVRVRGETFSSLGLSLGWPTARSAGLTTLKAVPTFILAAAAFIVIPLLLAGGNEAPPEADMSMYNSYWEGNLPLLLMALPGVYVASSLGEELVYRGFLFTRLDALFGSNGRASMIGAFVTSAALFGVAHYKWGMVGVIQMTLVGGALGLCFLIFRRNLWPLVLAHIVLDTLLFVQLYLGG